MDSIETLDAELLEYKSTSCLHDASRFSRQLILPELGIAGQESLQKSKILVVGMGGLGSPCSLYLASMGVGFLGVVDHDVVDESNLHRQILHSTNSVGMQKVSSAAERLKTVNPHLKVQEYDHLLTSDSAMDIIEPWDVVMDCTDNVATRYLLNDACVLLDKPLVSAAAVKWEGQLTVYHYQPRELSDSSDNPSTMGPCLRCIFPKPPPVETVARCNDVGVMGVVPGILGTLQALEGIKIASKQPELLKNVLSSRLLLYNALSLDPVKTVRLRPRRKDCAVCGDDPTVTKLINYTQFCGSGPDDGPRNLKRLEMHDRITPLELKQLVVESKPHLLIDTRDAEQYKTCHFISSINMPLATFSPSHALIQSAKAEQLPIYVVCRRGNDSQLAVEMLKEGGVDAKDVVGGLNAWAKLVDPTWPTL
jgi:adenylyltransferase/sulfurtransferase